MKLAGIVKFSQRDSRWANEKLGTSSVNLDLYGCAVSALAMIEKYFGFDTDPGRLNALCISQGVYANRNLMQWWQIGKVNEFVTLKDWIDCITTPAPINKIEEALNAGLPCILHVDLNPNQPGADHLIVCIGMTEDKHLLCYDPWYKDEDAIFFDARYGSPEKGIFRIMIFNGPVASPEAPQPTIADLNGQIDQYKQHIEDIKEHLRPAGVMPGEGLPEIIGAIDNLIALKKEYEVHLEKDKANGEKPKEPTEKLTERYLGQITFWNLITRFFIKEKP